MLARLTLALVVLVVLAAPGAPAAVAQSSPFAPLPQQAPQTPTVVPSTDGNVSDGGGLTTFQQVLIFGGGVALILGIAFAILGDARKHAPVERGPDGRPAAEGAGAHGSKRYDKARARSRAKRARAARKRNR
jgi:hypothetical protein